MHPSTLRTSLLGLRRLSLPTQQPPRRAPETADAGAATSRALDALTLAGPVAVLEGDIDGTPARVFDLTSRGARIELSHPVDLAGGTLRLQLAGAVYELNAHVRWYRRHPDGPAAYGLEFSAPPAASGAA